MLFYHQGSGDRSKKSRIEQVSICYQAPLQKILRSTCHTLPLHLHLEHGFINNELLHTDWVSLHNLSLLSQTSWEIPSKKQSQERVRSNPKIDYWRIDGNSKLEPLKQKKVKTWVVREWGHLAWGGGCDSENGNFEACQSTKRWTRYRTQWNIRESNPNTNEERVLPTSFRTYGKILRRPWVCHQNLHGVLRMQDGYGKALLH